MWEASARKRRRARRARARGHPLLKNSKNLTGNHWLPDPRIQKRLASLDERRKTSESGVGHVTFESISDAPLTNPSVRWGTELEIQHGVAHVNWASYPASLLSKTTLERHSDSIQKTKSARHCESHTLFYPMLNLSIVHLTDAQISAALEAFPSLGWRYDGLSAHPLNQKRSWRT